MTSDWFTFEAKKGDAYWIEVISQRLGLVTDPFVLVQRVTKNEKGEPDHCSERLVHERSPGIRRGAVTTGNPAATAHRHETFRRWFREKP